MAKPHPLSLSPSAARLQAAARPINILLASVFFAGAALAIHPEEASFAWRYETRPENPMVGESFLLVLRVEGLSGAALGDIALEPGLELLGSSTRPVVDPATGRRDAEFSLELLARSSGNRFVSSMEVSGREGRLAVGPLRIALLSPGEELRGQVWRWAAPDRVYRYSSFALRLEKIGDESGEEASVSFASSPGLAVEPTGEALSWICTALEEGKLLLPEAQISPGPDGAKPVAVPSRSIQVLPLPPALASTRASGDFELRFEGPSGQKARVGELLEFRYILSGPGNHPSVLFPPVKVSLEGETLSELAFSERRKDLAKPGKESYEGSSILELSLTAPGPGRLRLEPGTFPFIAPDGVMRELRPAALELEIGASLGKTASADPFAAVGTVLASLAKRPPDSLSPVELAFLEAEPLWRAGERGKALAIVYGAARRTPLDRRGADLRESLAAFVAAGPPLRDAYPAPGILALAGLVLLALGAFLLVLAFPRFQGLFAKRGPKKRRPVLGAMAGLVLVAALALFTLGALSLAERNLEYAVVWTGRALTVPSKLATGGTELVRGQTGLVVGRTTGYVGLKFADGSMGWVPSEAVYSY